MCGAGMVAAGRTLAGDIVAMTSRDSPVGLQRGTVRLAPADALWPEVFRAAAGCLAARIAAAGLPNLTFEHVGSTAVSGLVAKPIIDFMAGYDTDTNPRLYFDVFRSAGYEYRGPQGVPLRELFVLGPELRRTHHLNLVQFDGVFWLDHIVFRDRLRSEPAIRAAYAALKHRLAAAHAADRGAYTEGKAAFVDHVTRGGHSPPAS